MTQIVKTKRYVNEENLKRVRSKPCACCGKTDSINAHHIKSRGSGGGDYEFNLLAVCYLHHAEIHKRGISYMVNKYFNLSSVLHKNGWRQDSFGKWINIKEENDGN